MTPPARSVLTEQPVIAGRPVLAGQWVCALALNLAPVAGYGQLFANGGQVVPLSAAAVIGGLTALCPHRRLPALTNLAVGVLVATLTWWTATRWLMSQSRFSEGVDWVTPLWHGLPRLLDLNRPVDATRDTLIVPFLVTFCTAHITVLAIRFTTSALAPAAPPAVALAGQLLLVAGAGPSGLVAAGFIAAAVLLVWLRTAPARGVAFGWAAADLAYGAVVLAAAMAVTAVLSATVIDPERRPFDPQQDWPHGATENRTSPLAEIKGLLITSPPQVLFTVTVTAGGAHPAVPDRVVMATLDQYDGLVWTSSAHFRIAGTVLRETSGSTPIEATFTLAKKPPGGWLPVFPGPVTLRSSDRRCDPAHPDPVLFDPATETVAAPTSAWAPCSYQETSLGTTTADDQLSEEEQQRYLRLPDAVVHEMGDRARTIAPAGTAAQKLTAIERQLRSLPYSVQAPAGHSEAALLRVLDQRAPRNAGYAEQHAAAFAVLARALGVPTRVLVGYRLLRTGGRTYRLTTADADAWPQAWVDGRWQDYDPTDRTRPVSLPGTPVRTSPEPSPVPPPPAVPTPGKAPQSSRPPAGQGSRWLAVPKRTAGRAVVIVSIGVILTLGLGLPVIVSTVKRARRRRRRRHREAAMRVVGAWQEVMDRLSVEDVPIAVSATPAAVVRAAAQVFPAQIAPLRVLAPMVSAAVFDRHRPSRVDADQAWELEAEFRRLAGRAGSWWHRLRVEFDPRPLRSGGALRMRRSRKEQGLL